MKYCKSSIFVFLLLLISSDYSFGQFKNLILTKDQNKKWLDSVAVLSISEQLKAIKYRALSDTVVFNSKQIQRDLIILENEANADKTKKYGYFSEGRLNYILQYQSTKSKKFMLASFYQYNWTDNKAVLKFCNFLTEEKIKKIEVLTDQKMAEAIYGSISTFSFIILNLSKPRYMREFNRLHLNRK